MRTGEKRMECDMAEELQSLLEKIRADGIEKAEAEREEILKKARAEAEEIVAAARSKAKELTDGAAAEAESSKKRAENAIRQAARDIVLKLKTELENRLRRAVSASVKEAMTPAFMAELIRGMAADFAEDPGAQITVLASARDAEALASAVRDTLAADFKAEPKVFADASVKGGLQISFSGDEVFFDFSEEAVTALVAGYAGEKLAAILENR